MARFIVRRFAGLLFVLLGVSLLTFFLAQIVPVDPAATALGSNAREEQIEAYRQQLGLDQPAPVQYLNYMQRLLRGDLGQSIRTRRPVTDDLRGQAFVVREKGRWLVTPLFLALLVVEFSDIIFAIDSVPAIFAVTKEPLIVFTSNIFAILGLRSLYFLLAGVVDRFHYLKYGLGLILIFVGLKMVWLNEAFGGKFPIHWSLGIIALILGASAALSVLIKPKQKTSVSALSQV